MSTKLPFLQVIDDLFTPEECQQLIAIHDTTSLQEIDRDIAIYDREVFVDPDLATHLYHKIQHLLPKTYQGHSIVGLNDNFRFSKYHPGGFFQIHKDGFNQDSQGHRSIMTLNIFLNDDFQGGETDFFHEDKITRRLSAKPKPGRAALFDSQQYHCGNTVQNGCKYLLRTDVMVDI